MKIYYFYILIILFVINVCGSKTKLQATLYHYYCVGNCTIDANIKPQSGIVLMGGGTDVDSAFIWMGQRSKGGDFLIIRTSDSDGYNQYIYDFGNSNSVATIVLLDPKAAYDSFVLQKVNAAEAIWFAGGDQWLYYSQWKDTPLIQTVQQVFNQKNAPIGGTSAGNMVMPQFIYNAQFDSIYSSEALKNPYNNLLTLGTNFLDIPLLQRVVTDTHFVQRDRMGRLIGFGARLLTDVFAQVPVLGIGVDEGSALLIDPSGLASLSTWDKKMGAYFLTFDEKPQTCAPFEKLTYRNISTFRVLGNLTNVFNFAVWQPNTALGTSYTLSVKDGDLSSSSGQIY
eukprot:TRINITY_DN4516_c1_g3_i1.p1 TRINITY_DN4516_c1_g3~~TRINITY_DN4516_c1_g3_i1.p1  ORF type:complete len:340 (+),score=130.55 TRINITY_DN4516_c1_g3_i1:78-1097(+)